MIPRCDDPKCKGYGKKFVDRGYGSPVCPSSPPSLNPVPMDSRFEGKYDEEEEDVATQDNRAVIYPDGKDNAGKEVKEQTFRQHPELVKGIRIQYADRDSKTRAAVITARTGNFITVKDALKQRHRIRLSEVRGYWKPRVKASPKNMISIGH